MVTQIDILAAYNVSIILLLYIIGMFCLCVPDLTTTCPFSMVNITSTIHGNVYV